MKEQISNLIIKGPSLEEFVNFHKDLSAQIKKEREFLAQCTQKNVIDLWNLEVKANQESLKQLTERIEELSKKNEDIGRLLKEILYLLGIDESK